MLAEVQAPLSLLWTGRFPIPCPLVQLELIFASILQASSGKGDGLWDRLNERIQNSITASRSKLLQSNGLIDQGFVMPKTFPELSKPEHRYEKFVKQIQAENPGAKLTRKMVDTAAKALIERQWVKSPNAVARAANVVGQVGPLKTASRFLDINEAYPV
jgi:hypothetical protein